jgi:predicted  nucleic acid-binding Zn-ribbon protein
MTDLETLLVVQGHDTTAEQLKHKRIALAERSALDALRTARAAAERQRSSVQGDVDGHQGELTHIEHDVDAVNAKRKDLTRKLQSTAVPREAQTLQHELDGLAERVGHLEDRELELMEAIEPLAAEIAALDARVGQLDADIAAGADALGAAEAAVDAEIAANIAGRAVAVAAVPEALLARYDAMRPRLGGVAVAKLVAGRCTGCHLQLSTSEVDRIRHEPPDSVVTCEECGRMLVH